MPDFWGVYEGDQHNETDEEFEERIKRQDKDEIDAHNRRVNNDCGPGW